MGKTSEKEKGQLKSVLKTKDQNTNDCSGIKTHNS